MQAREDATARRLRGDTGTVLLDVAELDDISGVLLMTVLLALIPVIQAGGALWGPVAGAGGDVLRRLALLAAFCLLFARYVEPVAARAMSRWERPPERLLAITALGTLIAALAGALGFSLAIGALFAGLIFSRRPRPVRTDRGYTVLFDFLVPFFFVGIGLNVELDTLAPALGTGVVLAVAAVAGKLLGAGLPARLTMDRPAAVALGVSMVPRAEIAMVVLAQGHAMGPEVVPDRLYGGMALTCTATPPLLATLLATLLSQRTSRS